MGSGAVSIIDTIDWSIMSKFLRKISRIALVPAGPELMDRFRGCTLSAGLLPQLYSSSCVIGYAIRTPEWYSMYSVTIDRQSQ